jgi:hypothetical protein
MSGGGRQRIFISYRRDETAAHAGRIYDAMVARFGEDNVFMDVEMEPGVDFVELITDVVSRCSVLIAVMGKSWAEASDPDGRPRLHDEADFVRLEVSTAIQNPDVTVIPALVDKAQMPKPDQLPDAMRPLARRNALELSDGRWRYDVGRLNDTLEQLLIGLTGFPEHVRSEPPTPNPDQVESPTLPLPPPGPPEPESRTPAAAVRLILEGALLAAAVAFFARWLADAVPDGHGDLGHVAAIVAQRAITWGLTGGVVALWLGARTKRTDLGRCVFLGLGIGALAGAAGGVVFAVPTRLPDPNLGEAAKENWDATSLAVTGGVIGALIGGLWRPPNVGAGIASGALAGLLIQVVLNSGDWNSKSIPGVSFDFLARAGAIVGAALAVLLLLEHRRQT